MQRLLLSLMLLLAAGPAVRATLTVPLVESGAVGASALRSDANQPPSLRIVSPLDMLQLPADEPATLVAQASDSEDGDLGHAVGWSSSRDGALGRGASLSPSLSLGVHTLTARVSDAGGLVEEASLEVEVTAGGRVLLTAGDIASCSSTGDEATAALLDQRFGRVLTLGDNAYRDGTAADFASCYEPSWGRHKARTRAAVGNHEYRTEGAAGHFAYFGASAGDPDQGWYSFDVGSWHVAVLNSNCREVGGCTRTSPQGVWLEADLAANPRDCTLAVWHHPVFSSGAKHGGAKKRASNEVLGRLAVLRRTLFSWRSRPVEDATPRDLYDIFHSHGGDVVLTGHDHNYERFAPQDAFGNADPSAPRQFVVGTGGASLRPMGEIQPHSVTSAGDTYGLLALTLHESAYHWEFLPAAGYSYRDSGSASCVAAPRARDIRPPELASDAGSQRDSGAFGAGSAP